MRQKLLGLLVLALALSACAPNVIATSSGQPSTPVVAVETLPPSSTPGDQAAALVTPASITPPPGTTACSDPVDVPAVDGKVSYNGISFSIDPSIAYPLAAMTCQELPYNDNQAPGEAHPPYTDFFFPTYHRQNVDFQPEVRVVAITDNMSQFLFPLNVLGELKTTLDQRPEPAGWYKAPLSARQKYLDFASGSGVRGLVQYMQDVFFFTNNGLLYEFNGLTQDGRYFVSVRYPVGVPFLMELASPVTLPPTNLNAGAIPIPEWPNDYEAQRKVVEAYNAEALTRLEQMDDAEALPGLAALDALVQSIQVSAP